jgi:arsenate reductase (glutaredoxin)
VTLAMYGIPNCDTIKRAAAYLRERAIAFEFHDYRRHPVPPRTLSAWARAVGWQTLLNRNSTTFRGLSSQEREGLDEARALQLMQTHPALIRRPVFVRDAQVIVGFDDAARRLLAERQGPEPRQ